MNFFNKKISLAMALTSIFCSCSLVYYLGYKLAMNKFNSLISFAEEKQKMYGNLSEIDYNIRNECISNLDESKILQGIYKGYISSINGCKIFDKDEYNSYISDNKNIISDITWDIINDNIGYINFKCLGDSGFETTTEKFNDFKEKNINNIIIDLRNCIKCDKQEVFKILKDILPQGTIYKVDKKGNKEIVCEGSGENNSRKFVLLIGKRTCGMGEVFALAMKDILGSKTIGENTNGNTYEEKKLEISENEVIIFPYAKYITSSGNDFYNIGISPDLNIKCKEENLKFLYADNLPYSEDDQLQGAINLFDSY